MAAVELGITDQGRVVRTEIVETKEPVKGELPGNLATAMGHLMQRLAVDCLAMVGGSS